MHAYMIYNLFLKICTYTQIEELLLSATAYFCALVAKYKYDNHPYWIRKIMEYINEHLHVNISLEKLSNIVHLTPAYVSTTFKKENGFSIKEYIQRAKIEEAKYLLTNTDIQILSISTSLMYSSQTYFSKIFKRYTGYLPSEYRQLYKWK